MPLTVSAIITNEEEYEECLVQVNGILVGKASVEISAKDDILQGGVIKLIPLSKRPGTSRNHEVPPVTNEHREDSSSRSSTPVPSPRLDLVSPASLSSPVISESFSLDGVPLSTSQRKIKKELNSSNSGDPSSKRSLSSSASSTNKETVRHISSNSPQVLNSPICSSTPVKPPNSSDASKTLQKANLQAPEGNCPSLSQVLGMLHHRSSTAAPNDIPIPPVSQSQLIQNDLDMSDDDDDYDSPPVREAPDTNDNEVEFVTVKDAPTPRSRGSRPGVTLRTSGRIVKPVNYSEKDVDYMQMMLAPFTFAIQLENEEKPSSLVKCSLCNKTLARNWFIYHIEVKHCHLDKAKEPGRATKGQAKVKCEMCGRSMLPGSVKRHVREFHMKKNSCKRCRRKFMFTESLMSHKVNRCNDINA